MRRDLVVIGLPVPGGQFVIAQLPAGDGRAHSEIRCFRYQGRKRHEPLAPHCSEHRRRRISQRGRRQCAGAECAVRDAATDASGTWRHRSRTAQRSARIAESGHLCAAGDRSRHGGEPEVSVFAIPHATGARRLDPSGYRARARNLEEHRRRRHAPEHRRRARAALAQGRRMGLHAVWSCPHHRGRPGRPQLRR